MDSTFVDVAVEFFGVAFHNILYYASVYPRSIFETRKKYNVVVYRSTHPEVNQYLDLCLKSITECLKSAQLKRVEFAVTDDNYVNKMCFKFDIRKTDQHDETQDAYLVQAEQNLRVFCLNLASRSANFETPENASFSIYIHTTESTAVAMASNPDLDDFPLIEIKEKFEESNSILPLRTFSIRDSSIDSYVELYPLKKIMCK